MTIYEALKLSNDLIESLERAGVKLADHKYVRLFEDFKEYKERGEKVSYIIAVLAQRYNVSERSVYDIIRRLKENCKLASI